MRNMLIYGRDRGCHWISCFYVVYQITRWLSRLGKPSCLMSFLFVNHDVLNCNFIEVKDIPSISSISVVDLSILGNTLMSKVFFEDNIFPQNEKIIIK